MADGDWLKLKQSENIMSKENEFVNALRGDLGQLARQKSTLNSRGIETKQSDVFPCVMRKDIPRAISMIWDNSVEGWWHYKELYLEYGVCTEKEFKDKLSIACSK